MTSAKKFYTREIFVEALKACQLSPKAFAEIINEDERDIEAMVAGALYPCPEIVALATSLDAQIQLAAYNFYNAIISDRKKNSIELHIMRDQQQLEDFVEKGLTDGKIHFEIHQQISRRLASMLRADNFLVRLTTDVTEAMRDNHIRPTKQQNAPTTMSAQ